uniref:Uncharacterized protein n=1 Tax=Cacopsylla melanoneura TaxID=428564 RepID=A0A8D9A4A1_9HEMI
MDFTWNIFICISSICITSSIISCRYVIRITYFTFVNVRINTINVGVSRVHVVRKSNEVCLTNLVIGKVGINHCQIGTHDAQAELVYTTWVTQCYFECGRDKR